MQSPGWCFVVCFSLLFRASPQRLSSSRISPCKPPTRPGTSGSGSTTPKADHFARSRRGAGGHRPARSDAGRMRSGNGGDPGGDAARGHRVLRRRRRPPAKHLRRLDHAHVSGAVRPLRRGALARSLGDDPTPCTSASTASSTRIVAAPFRGSWWTGRRLAESVRATASASARRRSGRLRARASRPCRTRAATRAILTPASSTRPGAVRREGALPPLCGSDAGGTRSPVAGRSVRVTAALPEPLRRIRHDWQRRRVDDVDRSRRPARRSTVRPEGRVLGTCPHALPTVDSRARSGVRVLPAGLPVL